MKYHAHIYWQTYNQRALAMQFRNTLIGFGCTLGRIWDEPIGPHPLAMYQVNYTSENAEVVEKFLSDKGLSVLLHEDTGDDVRDHTQGARWFGKELDLDIEWLREHARKNDVSSTL
jgi:aromatic ring-cleaving dioxygenase